VILAIIKQVPKYYGQFINTFVSYPTSNSTYTACMLHWVIRLYLFQIHSCMHMEYINQSWLVFHRRKNRRVKDRGSSIRIPNWLFPLQKINPRTGFDLKLRFTSKSKNWSKNLPWTDSSLWVLWKCFKNLEQGSLLNLHLLGKPRTGGYNKIKEPPNTGWFTWRYQRNEDGYSLWSKGYNFEMGSRTEEDDLVLRVLWTMVILSSKITAHHDEWVVICDGGILQWMVTSNF
jgi:hypothetical protein